LIILIILGEEYKLWSIVVRTKKVFVWEWTLSLRSALFSFCGVHVVRPSCIILISRPSNRCIQLTNNCLKMAL
jgi:hypothetical protein